MIPCNLPFICDYLCVLLILSSCPDNDTHYKNYNRYAKAECPFKNCFLLLSDVENMAQTADILILSTERYAGKVPLFLGVNNVKFLAKIKPGDTLETHAVFAKERAEKAIVTCSCEVYNAGVLACTGEVTLAMR